MDNHECAICQAPFTADNAAVNPRFLLTRKTPRHTWKHTKADMQVCEQCANTDKAGQDSKTGLWAIAMREHTAEEGWDRAVCETCGTPVLLRRGTRRTRSLCSARCRRRLNTAEPETEKRSCAYCGEPMTGRSDRQYCSSKCRVAAHRNGSGYASKVSQRPGTMNTNHVIDGISGHLRATEQVASYIDVDELSPAQARDYWEDSQKGYRALKRIMRELERRSQE